MEGVRILQIPDLHTDAGGAFPGTPILIDKIVSELDSHSKFDLIISTGDITDKSNPDGMKAGFEFLRELRNKLGKPPILITPGNHDANCPDQINEDYFDEWPAKDRYANFEENFNLYRETIDDNNIIRPLYFKKHIDPKVIKSALDSYIENGFKREELNDDERDYLPFFWLRAQKVFCYLLSSVDLSGSLYTDDKDQAIKIIKVVNDNITDNDVKDKLLRRAFQRDIPQIDNSQTKALEQICSELRKHDEAREDFELSLKIVALHHPLVQMPDEVETREFDNVVNGPNVLSKLTQLGFSVVIYGHKHENRISINFGNWTYQRENQTDEVVGIAGGKIFVTETNPTPSFNFLEIEEMESEKFYERTLVVKKIYTSGSKESTEQKLISLQRDGRLRWLHSETNDRVSNHLVRNHEVGQEFSTLLKNVEKQFRSHKNENWTKDYDEADQFIIQFMKFLEEYSKGEYGLDKAFIDILESDLKEAKALYFVDILESPAWAHPNFMSHLAIQIKAYLTRNMGQFTSGSWSHSNPVEIALQGLDIHPSENTADIKRGRVLAADRPTELSLDICRILIWRPDKLRTTAGRILIKLHDIFNIPLFFIDKNVYQEIDKLSPFIRDFHLVVAGNNKVSKGFIFDDDNKKREEINDLDGCRQKFLKLVKDKENLKSARIEAGL